MNNLELSEALSGMIELRDKVGRTVNPMQKAILAEAAISTMVEVVGELVIRELKRGTHGK